MRSPTRTRAVDSVVARVLARGRSRRAAARGAGLKKCMPTTRSGCRVASAISVTDSADVFVARTASGRVMRSSSAKSSRFGSSSSTIASITRSQSARSESVGRQRQPAERGVALVRVSAPSRLRVEVALDRRASALRELQRHLAADRVVARRDADLRDARAHRSEPDDADSRAGDPTEDRSALARPVGMKSAFVAALLLLLVSRPAGRSPDAARGRRPALARRPRE